MNVGNPERAFEFSFIPNDGVGLAREEFVINEYIKIHPKALINFKDPGPGFFELIRCEVLFLCPAGEWVHDLDHSFHPFLVADKGSFFDLPVLVGTELEISFGGLDPVKAFVIFQHCQQVDFSVCGDGCVQFREQSVVVFGINFAADLKAYAGIRAFG